ncbi:peptidylprolyl isomerase [Prochlorococcus sp. MIT 1223]|uniref:peptidylprolyl isomerase n=1 Tax=Prochlorococcus sp. MIT 1223 TaxID=3096217 RepID=UPI002A764E99|nr:peptidylprolyl isomerase [Prochlorococcus sp. MIT 1223]
MAKQFFLFLLAIALIPGGFFFNKQAIASLPPGNRVKDPYAILRNSLPIEQKDLREVQNQLEETSDALRGSRWPTISKATSRSKFVINNKKNQILQSLPESKKNKGEAILSSLKNHLDDLAEEASEKDKSSFIESRKQSLQEIGELESLIVKDEFPYEIPAKYDNLPRLLGRASVEINTTKGNMTAIIDGYNAPLTAGSFIDLVQKGFYDKLPINRAEEFFVLQTGDPEGDAIGYLDPETNKDRLVPLEIRIPGQKETIYENSFEELGLYTENPVLPFATLGTLGWAHSDKNLNDGSSQFFFFLYEAELNPAGRNLIDGRYSAFGYVVEGEEILSKLEIKDRINSIKVLNGSERFKKQA